jgi:stage 0 sporulation regulatory protein
VIIHQYQPILLIDSRWDWVRRKQKLYQEKEQRILLEEINECKTRLYAEVEKKGLNHLTDEETIRRSQELDQLIYQYQKSTLKGPKRQEASKALLWSVMLLLPNVLAEV